MISMRSNLGRLVASGVTEAEAEQNRQKAERDAFHRDGLVVIAVDDPALPGALRAMVEAVGQKRYGRRPAQRSGDRS